MVSKSQGKASLLALGGAFLLFLVLGPWVFLSGRTYQPTTEDRSVAFSNPAVMPGGGSSWWGSLYYSDAYRPAWRPLATLSLKLQRSLTNKKADFVRFNAFVLGGIACLLVLLLYRLGVPWWLAAPAGVLLELHPSNVDLVASLAARADLLAWFFSLASLLFYLELRRRAAKSRSSRGWTYTLAIGTALSAFLGLLCKESAVLVLPAVLGLEVILRWGRRLQENRGEVGAGAGGAAAAILLLLVVVVLWGGLRAGALRGVPWEVRKNEAVDYVCSLEEDERVRLALWLPYFYIRLSAGLEPVLVDYSHLIAHSKWSRPVVLGEPRTYTLGGPGRREMLFGPAVLALLIVVALLALRRAPVAALGAWLAFLGLVAVMPLLRPNGVVASARLLLPVITGLTVFVVGVLWAVVRRTAEASGPGQRLVVSLVSSGLLLAAAGLAGAHLRPLTADWESTASMVERIEAHTDSSPFAIFFRARAAMESGDKQKAAALLMEGIKVFPRSAGALLEFGLISAERGDMGLAGRALRDAALVAHETRQSPLMKVRAHTSYGTFLATQHLPQLALKQYLLALAADSTDVYALSRAGHIEVMKPKTARAGIKHLEAALRLDPDGRLLGEKRSFFEKLLSETREKLAEFVEDSAAYEEALRRLGQAEGNE